MIDTENRFSGIPTIRYEMEAAQLPELVFESFRGVFRVTLYNSNNNADNTIATPELTVFTAKILEFCAKPKTRDELAKELNLSSVSYMMSRYINPLIEEGGLKMTIPDKPRSRNQMYYSVLD